MGLRYENLDAETRALMVAEIEADIRDGRIYISNYLNAAGASAWPENLKNAADTTDDDTLAEKLRNDRAFKERVERRKPTGGFSMVTVPVTAAQTLSESQFNMYYMRGLALRAISSGSSLVVYRGKAVERPRPESELMIGNELDPVAVLQALRETLGVEPSIGIPLPNSGLCVRLR